MMAKEGLDSFDPTMGKMSDLAVSEIDRATGASSQYIRKSLRCSHTLFRHPLPAENGEEVLDHHPGDSRRY